MTRDIGLKVKAPKNECSDEHCPFHGKLAVRGKLFDGKVSSTKAKQTVTLKKEAPVYFSKFRRYARGKSAIHAHLPPCIEVQEGDHAVAAECRPLSKSVSYVVVEVRK
jgi:small subunit ribosomal protein S17